MLRIQKIREAPLDGLDQLALVLVGWLVDLRRKGHLPFLIEKECIKHPVPRRPEHSQSTRDYFCVWSEFQGLIMRLGLR